MNLHLISSKNFIDAKATYDPKNKTFTVLKDSVVSATVAHSATFRGATTVEKLRAEYVKNNVVKKDVVFKSASTAANFVTGRSTNGLITWKNNNNVPLRDIIKTKVS